MKTYYQLKKNGVVVQDYESRHQAKQRAIVMERMLEDLNWRGDEDYEFAFGSGETTSRNEYEIELVRKRA